MSTIGIDSSLFVQIVSFLVLWFGLKRLIIDPMLQVLDARVQRTTGTQHLATELRAASERDAAAYEAQLQQVRHALAQETAAARAATAEAERQVLAEARDRVVGRSNA